MVRLLSPHEKGAPSEMRLQNHVAQCLGTNSVASTNTQEWKVGMAFWGTFSGLVFDFVEGGVNEGAFVVIEDNG